jgi:hypothetical protein
MRNIVNEPNVPIRKLILAVASILHLPEKVPKGQRNIS